MDKKNPLCAELSQGPENRAKGVILELEPGFNHKTSLNNARSPGPHFTGLTHLIFTTAV